ncbi:hypothetical protein ACOMHN_056867 [Nucella lapillus]
MTPGAATWLLDTTSDLDVITLRNSAILYMDINVAVSDVDTDDTSLVYVSRGRSLRVGNGFDGNKFVAASAILQLARDSEVTLDKWSYVMGTLHLQGDTKLTVGGNMTLRPQPLTLDSLTLTQGSTLHVQNTSLFPLTLSSLTLNGNFTASTVHLSALTAFTTGPRSNVSFDPVPPSLGGRVTIEGVVHLHSPVSFSNCSALTIGGALTWSGNDSVTLDCSTVTVTGRLTPTHSPLVWGRNVRHTVVGAGGRLVFRAGGPLLTHSLTVGGLLEVRNKVTLQSPVQGLSKMTALTIQGPGGKVVLDSGSLPVVGEGAALPAVNHSRIFVDVLTVGGLFQAGRLMFGERVTNVTVASGGNFTLDPANALHVDYLTCHGVLTSLTPLEVRGHSVIRTRALHVGENGTLTLDATAQARGNYSGVSALVAEVVRVEGVLSAGRLTNHLPPLQHGWNHLQVGPKGRLTFRPTDTLYLGYVEVAGLLESPTPLTIRPPPSYDVSANRVVVAAGGTVKLGTSLPSPLSNLIHCGRLHIHPGGTMDVGYQRPTPGGQTVSPASVLTVREVVVGGTLRGDVVRVVADDVSVGGQMTAVGGGHLTNKGPGAGVPSSTGASGASHGGRGGRGSTSSPFTLAPLPYGTIFQADQAGSGGGGTSVSGGGGGRGGGVIHLVIAGNLVVNGAVRVDGLDATLIHTSFPFIRHDLLTHTSFPFIRHDLLTHTSFPFIRHDLLTHTLFPSIRHDLLTHTSFPSIRHDLLTHTSFPFIRHDLLTHTSFPSIRHDLLIHTSFPFIRHDLLIHTSFPFIRHDLLTHTSFPFIRHDLLTHTSFQFICHDLLTHTSFPFIHHELLTHTSFPFIRHDLLPHTSFPFIRHDLLTHTSFPFIRHDLLTHTSFPFIRHDLLTHTSFPFIRHDLLTHTSFPFIRHDLLTHTSFPFIRHDLLTHTSFPSICHDLLTHTSFPSIRHDLLTHTSFPSIRHDMLTHTSFPSIRHDLLTHTSFPFIRHDLLIHTSFPSICHDLLTHTSFPFIRHDLLIHTSFPFIRYDLLTHTSFPFIRHDLLIHTSFPFIRHDLLTHTSFPFIRHDLLIHTSFPFIRHDLLTHTSFPSIRHDLLTHTSFPFIRHDLLTHTSFPFIRHDLLIHTSFPFIRHDLLTHTSFPFIRHDLLIHTSFPFIRHDLLTHTSFPFIRHDLLIHTSFPFIRHDLLIHTSFPFIRHDLLTHTSFPFIRHDLLIHTSFPFIRHDLLTHTSFPFIRHDLLTHTSFPFIRHDLLIHTSFPFIRHDLLTHTSFPSIRHELLIDTSFPFIRHDLLIHTPFPFIRHVLLVSLSLSDPHVVPQATHGGGGSGGSVRVRCSTFSGSGSISSNGGGGLGGGGGGAGGRVLVNFTTGSFRSGHVAAHGGSGAEPGGPGLIYLHGDNIRNLRVDNRCQQPQVTEHGGTWADEASYLAYLATGAIAYLLPPAPHFTYDFTIMEIYGAAHLALSGNHTKVRAVQIVGDDTGHLHVPPGNTLDWTQESMYQRANMTWQLFLYRGAELILPPAPVEIRAPLIHPAPCPTPLLRPSVLRVWGTLTGHRARLLIGSGQTISMELSAPRHLTFSSVTVQDGAHWTFASHHGNASDRWLVTVRG